MVRDTRSLLEKQVEDVTFTSKKQDFEDMDQLLKEYLGSNNLESLSVALLKIRQSVPTKAGIEVLYKIAADSHDSRQLLAAQILGYHRAWLTVSNGLHRHLELSRNTEFDPTVKKALVWGLRQREEISEFLEHPSETVAREAALGVPLGRRTIFPVLEFIRKSLSPELERILLIKLRHVHSSLMPYIFDIIVDTSWTENAIFKLFSELPQISVFEFFVDKEMAVGDVGMDIEKTSRWHSAVRIAKETLSSDPTGELIRFLLMRSGDNEIFSRRHGTFIRSVIKSVDSGSGQELIGDLEALTLGASEEKVFRLAQNLVELGSRLEGESAQKIQAMLEEWKSRSVELKLKIYHLEQRIV
tara:strand:+ start:12369 stop:13439 length:1071 start_codon:yes stop_codon:yes gene_type:complete